MPYEQVSNPTGVESFMVSALALSPDGSTVAAAARELGCFFDAKTGAELATWQESSAFERVLFRDDETLVIVGLALATVDPKGARRELSPHAIFKGDTPPHDAVIADDFLIALHEWETSGGSVRSAAFGVSLDDGTKVWGLDAELRALVLHGGMLLAAHGGELIHIDPESGDVQTLASLPSPIGAMWSDGASLYLAELEGFTLHRIDASGGVAASASMDDPIPVEGKPEPSIVQMAKLGDALVVRARNFSAASMGPVPWMAEDTLDLLDPDTLEPLEHGLGFEEACTELEWSFAQPEAMLSVGEDLWIGTPDGLIRYTP